MIELRDHYFSKQILYLALIATYRERKCMYMWAHVDLLLLTYCINS